jgi:phosphoribosyl-AMP cyclohydrolase / phosphoribosyl-ATP pyrophosphohydrolase
MDKKVLIPAIVQDYDTGEVLMLAYMDQESLMKSLEEGYSWFWSRSRKRLWKKGENSGNTQKIRDIRYDCDNDSILVRVEQKGSACHTGNRSCFYRKLEDPEADIDFKKAMDSSPEGQSIIEELYGVIKERIKEKKDGSYTYLLHKKGLDEILKKIGEEAIEVLLAAKHQEKKDIIYEAGDLLYHLLVLLAEKDIEPARLFEELRSRRK